VQGCPALRGTKERRGNRPEPRFVYLVYSALMTILAAALTPYWIIQGARHGKYFSNLRERLGFRFPALENLAAAKGKRTIWVHAVSVGEALSSITLAKRLKEKFPESALVVSTTTMTGHAVAREKMPFADAVIYFPLDWAFCVRRALQAVQPGLVILVETEIWPNFLHECRKRGVAVMLVSGRISDGSFARYRKLLAAFGMALKPFLRRVLAEIDAFLMQSRQDVERITELGAPESRIAVGGNLKYDLGTPEETPLSRWLQTELQRSGRSPVIVAGSVVATEEPLALIAFGVLQGEYPKALLVLAPRKPERFEAAAEFIDESNRKFVRRSALAIPKPGSSERTSSDARIGDETTVLLLDSIGELASLYRLADGVFVGGSLVASGGHNILEPAAFGKIPVFGESMENFAEMSRQFVESKAAIQVSSPEDAGVTWIELFRDTERSRRMGEAARRLVEESRGATDRALETAARLLRQFSSESK